MMAFVKGIRYVSWLLIMLLHTALWAQQPPLVTYEFNHIQQADGLSFNYVNCFFKDRDGFLWIGTNNGLNRFDGSRFTIFRRDPANPHSLGNNTVHAICQDKSGHLWLATDTGISEFNPETAQFRTISTGLGRTLGNCLNILCDRSGRIWFSTIHHGLFQYEVRTDHLTLYTHNPQDPRSLSENFISGNGLLEDPFRDGIWIGTRQDGGLNYLDIATGECQNYRHNPEALPIFAPHFTGALTLDGTQMLYVDNNEEQIVIFDLKCRRLLRTIKPISQTGRRVDELNAIFVDRQHNIWISSLSYLMFYVKAGTGQVSELMHKDTRRTSIVGSCFWAGWQDDDGTIWLGTVNGISYTNPGRAIYEANPLSRFFPTLKIGALINNFYEDSDGSWWGSEEHTPATLLHYAAQTDRLERYPAPGAFFAYGIGAYGPDLYVASPTHLLRFSKKTHQFTPIPLPAYVRTDKIRGGRYRLLQQNDLIWLFYQNKQTLCYQITTGLWHQYPIVSNSDHPKFWVRNALIDRHNAVWLELYPEGFAKFSPQTGQFILQKGPAEAEYENTISSFTEDKNGYFWLATNGYGLARYDPRNQQYRFWGVHDGLGDDHCLAAIPDRYGNIWVGSYNLFSIFTPARNQFLTISLPYSEDNQEYFNYMWPLRNGHILASIKGYLIEFKPEVLSRFSIKQARVLLSGLVASDSTYLLNGPTPTVQLKASDNSFSIQYSVLGPLHEKQYLFRYKLEGYDAEWSKASSQTSAGYTKLPGGDYVFAVKGVSINHTETPIRRLSIHIDTVFYQTAAFRALLLLTLLGIGLGLIRYRVGQTARLHHLQVQATRLERDKTEIQYQNLINHLNPHFLFNSLASLNSLIILDPKQASGFLQKLSAIYRYILQNKEKETISLSSELVFVQQYIELQQAQLEDGLQISIDVAPDYLAYEIVPVTLQNLFENAIKHNTTDEDSPLRIRVFVQDKYVWVVNNRQKKPLVKTSNKQGLDSLKKLYAYLSDQPLLIEETDTTFIVKVPLL
ncbi:ligand-binding sensor domain-containing protein [Spirosoma koreense]